VWYLIKHEDAFTLLTERSSIGLNDARRKKAADHTARNQISRIGLADGKLHNDELHSL
jgi:hypothetical protein